MTTRRSFADDLFWRLAGIGFVFLVLGVVIFLLGWWLG